MEFDDYQEKAVLTDQFPDKKSDSALMIPLLGIAGETGTLLSEFKKKIRDKESYDGFRVRAEEELGDVLWYVANLASHLGLSLSAIAAKNLHKTQERWPLPTEGAPVAEHLDEDYPSGEQLPRLLRVRVTELSGAGVARMVVEPDGRALGDQLTDNAYEDDGYRFHDVMHLANMAVLGWSPVMRKLLGRKRRSRPEIDEVEDGARAGIIEELIVAFVYANARERSYYRGIRHVDTEMLGTVKRLVSHLEVKRRPMRDLERAILQGYVAFRHLLDRRTALLELDLNLRQLKVIE